MTQRIFVTGASGYIGSAVAARLARAGHEVFGLTRSRERARVITALGVKPVFGDLATPADWTGVLQNCDWAVHAAFDAEHGAPEQDENALDAFRTAALDGRLRKLIYTSGIWVHGASAQVLDETAPLKPLKLVQWRAAHEEIALDLSSHEVVTLVMRPGMVYGEHRGVFGNWFAEAHQEKTVTYPGDGSQHWGMVHRDDVAEGYALALEDGETSGRYLLVDESCHTVKELAEAAAKAAEAKAKAWPAEEVIETLGPYGKALLNDLQVTSAKARRELGWVPRHTSFVTEAPELWREWQEARQAPVA
ncbi:MAG: NAD-dependent epimerase/dehydratase family protein [Candidatus Eisenbacteria bacterium]